MKLIHLSDLHIGKRVNEVSMLEDQEYVLRQILQIIDTEKADAVLIAGDVYDKSIPPAEAVTLFDDFLCRLAKRDLPVFIISGNHDSPERLAFGNRLLEHSGIHISPVYSGKIESVTLTDEYGAVNFWLLPFVKPVHVKRFYPDEGIESYTDAIRTAIQYMEVDQTVRNVLLTHQFVTGAATCESEELSVGGTDNVDAEVFEGFDYVALGHIHKKQQIGKRPIYYAGAPLKYSFGEAGSTKGMLLVTVDEEGLKKVEELPLTPLHDMRKIKGTLQELLTQGREEGEKALDYVQACLTDEGELIDPMETLRSVYPNAMQIVRADREEIQMEFDLRSVAGNGILQKRDAGSLFQDFYAEIREQDMTEEQLRYITGVIREAKERLEG